MTNNIDFIRGVVTLVTGAAVVLITLVSLIVMIFTGKVAPDVGVPAIVAIGTVAGGFLWASETAKQASKQTRADILTDNPEKPA
jgi:multisubunit Na+/H+ antiporter MnhB subunit